MVEITCQYCGDTIMGWRKTQRFCSKSCAKRMRDPSNGLSKVKMRCDFCGNIFLKIPANSSLNTNNYIKHDFCSQKCYHQFRSTITTTECKWCNKKVERAACKMRQNPSGNIFCSLSCSMSYRNANKTSGYRRSKLEVYLEDKIHDVYPSLECECNNRKIIGYELDFYFPRVNMAIEINGITHYQPIYGQLTLDRTQKADKEKIARCQQIGITLYIIDVSDYGHINQIILEYYWSIIGPLLEIYTLRS